MFNGLLFELDGESRLGFRIMFGLIGDEEGDGLYTLAADVRLEFRAFTAF